MILAWVVLFLVAICAYIDYKKTVIVWMACRLLFNAQVALRYSAPAMSLDFGMAILLIVMYYIKGENRGMTKSDFYLGPILIATIASYSLSFIFSQYLVGEGLRVFIKIFVLNFAFLFIFQRVLSNSNDVKLFLKAMIIVAILISALGLFEFVFHDNPYLDYVYYNSPQEGTEGRMYYYPPGVNGSLQMRYGMVRAYSTFGIHLAFGRACVLILGFLLAIRNIWWIKIPKWQFSTAIIMCIIGCIVSNSKTPLLGMVVMLMLFLKPSQLLSKKTIIIVVSIILVITILYQIIPSYFNNILSLFDKDLAEEGGGSSIMLRQRQLVIAWEMFQQNPILGNGPGSLTVLRRMSHGEDILGAEGALLSILPERGLLGYLVYLFTFVYFFRTSKGIIPTYKILIFLLSYFLTEIVSGIGDMTLCWAFIIAMRHIYLLNIGKEKRLLSY